jgi:hypothetical protein
MLPKPYLFSPGRTPRLWAALSLGLRSYWCDGNVRQTSAAQTQRPFSPIKKKTNYTRELFVVVNCYCSWF